MSGSDGGAILQRSSGIWFVNNSKTIRGTLCALSLLCLLIQSIAYPQSYTGVRIAYINSANNFDGTTHRPSVPVAFLERAKRDNYTHIMVEFYILEPGDWNNGNYRDPTYKSGDFYLTLNEIVKAVAASGLKIIPLIIVPGTAGVYPWWPALNSKVDCYSSQPAGRLPCIASGLDTNGVPLQPDGFDRVFTEAMKVLHTAYTAHYRDNMDYICLGYCECIEDDKLIWGTRAGRPGFAAPVRSIDRIWMDSHQKDESALVIESIKRRLYNVRYGNSKFSTAKVMVFGDMFSGTFQQAKGRTNIVTTSLPQNADPDFRNNVVVLPWWYDECVDPRKPCTEGGPNDFTTAAMLAEFTRNNIMVCPAYCITEVAAGYTELSICRRYLREAFEYMSAVKFPAITNNVIGFAAVHWSGNGYTTTDLAWNTMEYLAYGNQVARPQTRFSTIPPGAVDGVKISSLRCAQTETTQGDYLSVTGKLMFNNNKYNGRLDYPVENVTFYDAVIYCNERSKVEGLAPVYSYTSPLFEGDTSENCTGLAGLTADTAQNGYRLLSLEEWKYIYSAGTTTLYYWGNDWAAGKEYCWSGDNSGNPNVSHPVRQKKGNAWNVFDIAGNVAEIICDYSESDQLKAKCAIGDYSMGAGREFGSNRYFFSPTGVSSIQKFTRDPTRGFRVVRKMMDNTP